MWPCSQSYLDTLARSHTRLLYAEILKDGQPVATTDLTTGEITDPNTGLSLTIQGGSVNVSRQTVRRTCSLQFIDPSGVLLPEAVGDILAPYSTEIRLWSGVRYWFAPNPAPTLAGVGTEYELIPVGTFVITDIESQFPLITVSGSDRMWYMSNFVTPYNIAAGSTAASVLSALIGLKVPTQLKVINFPDDASADATVPSLSYDADSASADALHTVAGSAGWQIAPNPMGAFTANHEPTTDDPEVMTYTVGARSMMIGRPKRTIGGEVFNAVVYTNEGSQSGIPVRGYAQDDNPESMTYALRIGVRPQFLASPILTTNDQANKAARTALQRTLGVSDTVTITVVPNAALDAGDVIRVTDPTLEIDQKLIIDSFTLGLRGADGPMGLTCRTQVIR